MFKVNQKFKHFKIMNNNKIKYETLHGHRKTHIG